MSFSTFFILSAIGGTIVTVLVVAGLVVYLKKKGVLKQAKDAAVDAVKQDVQDAANKL